MVMLRAMAVMLSVVSMAVMLRAMTVMLRAMAVRLDAVAANGAGARVRLEGDWTPGLWLTGAGPRGSDDRQHVLRICKHSERSR